MRTYDIILKKRTGEGLSAEEIAFLVGGYCAGEIPDSQMAAFLMAVYFRSMTPEETSALTMAMVRSGQTLDLHDIPGVKVDKHSTGGVGDKTTLVLIPLLAAAGIPVVKMSGRSLGFTGGTLDKLESIPGFSTALTPERMIAQVKRIGAAIGGQTADLVPADKKIYALRDITATVDCIPLIAASVMSKKIAAGADAFVLDVKAGSGAFMKTVEDAMTLARVMVDIGKQVGKKTIAVITDMNQPLGCAIGNALEVREAIETLKGNGPEDLVELCTVLGDIALKLAGKSGDIQDLLPQGLAKLREIIEAQGGDPRVIDDYSLLPTAPVIRQVKSVKNGFVKSLDAHQIGLAAAEIGCLRGHAGAIPDLSAGIVLRKKIGDGVPMCEPLAEVHAASEALADQAAKMVLAAYEFGKRYPLHKELVHGVIE